MSAISRRDLFRSVFGRRTPPPAPAPPPAEAPPAPPAAGESPPLALILDRFCLAWQGSFCSVCSERCPEPGAITTERGKPRINSDLCTGCRICHEVCPAPKNAVFVVPRAPRPGMVPRSPEPGHP